MLLDPQSTPKISFPSCGIDGADVDHKSFSWFRAPVFVNLCHRLLCCFADFAIVIVNRLLQIIHFHSNSLSRPFNLVYVGMTKHIVHLQLGIDRQGCHPLIPTHLNAKHETWHALYSITKFNCCVSFLNTHLWTCSIEFQTVLHNLCDQQ